MPFNYCLLFIWQDGIYPTGIKDHNEQLYGIASFARSFSTELFSQQDDVNPATGKRETNNQRTDTATQTASGEPNQAAKAQAHNALPKQEQGSTGGLKSKTVSVHRSNDYLETERDLKSNQNGIIPMQDVGNDSRSLMLADKLAALFKGRYNNDTGKYGFEKIISINPKNDSAVVIDNDGQLKTFSAADNGDRWHWLM